MRILVTGATGFISNPWVKWLVDNTDHDITGIDDISFSNRDNFTFTPRSHLFICDITDYLTLNPFLYLQKEHFDIIYHFAAISSLPENQVNPTRAIQVNVEATANLLEYARRIGTKKFIFASSNAIYEHNNEILPHRETDTLSPQLIYPLTKKFSEELCSSYSFNYGLNTVCLRFSNIYGYGQDLKRKSPALTGYILDCLLRDKSPILHGDGTQKRDYLYIDDLIDFLSLELHNKTDWDTSALDTVLNISSNTWVSVKEIYELFAWKLGKYITKPTSVLPNIGSLEWTCPPIYRKEELLWDKYSPLFEGKCPLDEYAIQCEVRKDTLTSNLNACTQFNWNPKISMQEGIQRMIDAYVKSV